MRLNVNNFSGHFIDLAIAFILILTLINPIKRIFSEIKFYSENKWDFWLDSDNSCWAQSTFVGHLPNWPIGTTKFLAEGVLIFSRVALALLFIFQR
jgi:hypothetical protein